MGQEGDTDGAPLSQFVQELPSPISCGSIRLRLDLASTLYPCDAVAELLACVAEVAAASLLDAACVAEAEASPALVLAITAEAFADVADCAASVAFVLAVEADPAAAVALFPA